MTFENDKPTTDSDVVLDVRDLEVVYDTPHGEVQAVSDVSFQVHRGEAFALVGESGCGKSTTASAIMRIISKPGRVKSGQVISHDQDLMSMTDDEMAAVRGHRIGMIFQNPLDSLNPVYSLGYQISESLMVDKMEKAEAYKLAESTLRDVRIPDAAERMRQYPHEISGGMRQRVMIGMMLCREPEVLIADEPTTALDVTIQAQILDLLRNLKDQINSSIMFITHDLGVIAEMADYVVVMYAGRIVEQGTAEEIFSHPAHPYTIGLMASKPVVGRQVEKLYSIPGKVPNPINMPNYCYFKDRCEMCVNGCEGDYPCEVSISPTHKVSCYRYYDGKRPDLEEAVEEELAEGKENGKEGE